MAEVVPFFAVPFAFARLQPCEALNRELRTLFLAREADGARYANPRPITKRNAATFESHFDVFRWPDRSVQQLKEFCWAHLVGTIAQLNGYDDALRRRLLIYSDAWFHVTRRGGWFGLHNHPNAAWSGVYCVDPGRHDEARPDSGVLTFANPVLASAMHVDAGNAGLTGAFGTGVRGIRLEAGQLVLFPSWVLHEVQPFEGEGERLTVAFNCWFGLDGEPGASN
jgi:uncharacterized protein (TIGR02466 family)